MEEIKKGTAWGITRLPQNERWTAYKKIWCRCSGLDIHAIATLEIPPGATVIRPRTSKSSNFHEKIPSNQLRADQAKVISIIDPIDHLDLYGCHCYSTYDISFRYRVDEIVQPEMQFDTNINRECTSGIHFFMSENEARDYR